MCRQLSAVYGSTANLSASAGRYLHKDAHLDTDSIHDPYSHPGCEQPNECKSHLHICREQPDLSAYRESNSYTDHHPNRDTIAYIRTKKVTVT